MGQETVTSTPGETAAAEGMEGQTAGQTREQLRAAFALEKVRSRFLDDGWKVRAGQSDRAQEYARVVRGLPAMVMTNGLGQSLAFLMSRTDSQAAPLVVADLSKWLRSVDGLYSAEITAPLVSEIVNKDREKLRRATDETLALLEWWVKFVRAFLPKPEGGD